MQKITSLSCVLMLGIFLLIGGLPAHAQMTKLETQNLRLLYNAPIHTFIAPHAARCFENALDFHCRLWNYRPHEKVSVSLWDIADYGNAGATATPRNRLAVMLAPASYAYETAPANERMNTIMNHELVHLVALDQASSRDRFFRGVFFGKVEETSDHPLTVLYTYLTTPRRSAPRWFHEGMAVFLETWMAGGIGRTMGSYDEMVFRAMVRDSARFYDPIGLESEGTKVDFQVGVNSYLYGNRFFSYLALCYEPEKLVSWVSRVDGSSSYYASQFRRVFGRPLAEVWDEWVQWEHAFQKANLDTIRLYPVTTMRPISPSPLGALSRAWYDSEENCIYAATAMPGQVANIAAIDMEDGSRRRLADVKGPSLYFVSSIAWDQKSGSLFYTTDNDEWRDLYTLNPATGESRLLMKDARVGDLAYCAADSTLWGVRHFNALSTVVRMPYPFTQWDQVHTFPYGRDIYDIDVSPDGRFVTGGLAEISGRQLLIRIDVESARAGKATCDTLFEFGNSIPATFTFSPDGRYLYGSSYYTGVSNIYRYDLQADSMEALSNCETGLFRPIPLTDDSLIVFEYTGKGFIAAKIADSAIMDINPINFLGQQVVEAHPVVREWMAGSPGDIDLDVRVTDTGVYRAFRQMELVSLYPVVEGFKDYPAYGLRTNFTEPLGMQSADLSVSYTPNSDLPQNQRLHVEAAYQYLEWTLRGTYNDADFYDLFGPTKTSRKGRSLGLTYRHNLLYDLPRTLDMTLSATGYSGLERLPEAQNIATSYDKFASVSGELDYKHQQASLAAVDYEKGWLWRLGSSMTIVNKQAHPRLVGELGVGFALPWGHSSLWFRNAAGWAYGDRGNPFASFFFGGFGNNWIDYQAEKRYRSYQSFPGVEINEIAGRSFDRMLVELILPPLRFRHVGGSALYVTWMRTSLFATGLVTDPEREETRFTAANIGAQCDFRLEMLSHLRLTLSVAFASAFGENRDRTDEWMVSLRIL